MVHRMKWIDLFAGAGLATEAAKSTGCEVVAAVEYGYPRKVSINDDPLRTYVLNHGRHIIQQDVTTLKGWQFDPLEPDGIMGGPPCQDFSLAGKKEGVGGENGWLIAEFMRVAHESSAEWVLMENVKGLLSNQDAMIMIGSLEEEYELHPAWVHHGEISNHHLFNSVDYGSPQRRERVYFLWSKSGRKVYTPKPLRWLTITMGAALGIKLENDDYAPTIDAGGTRTGGYDMARAGRKALGRMGFEGRLTPEQCATLQGLAGYKFVGRKTSVYRQIGNGWEQYLATNILNDIKKVHNGSVVHGVQKFETGRYE